MQLLDRTQDLYRKQSRIKAGRELYQVDGSGSKKRPTNFISGGPTIKKAPNFERRLKSWCRRIRATEALNQYRDYLIEAPEFSDYQHAYSEFSAGWSLSEKRQFAFISSQSGQMG